MSIEQTPIQTAQTVLSQNVQQTQQQVQPSEQKLYDRVSDIIAQMLQISNDLAYDIATLENENCQKCTIVSKCRILVKLLKELIVIQRQYRK